MPSVSWQITFSGLLILFWDAKGDSKSLNRKVHGVPVNFWYTYVLNLGENDFLLLKAKPFTFLKDKGLKKVSEKVHTKEREKVSQKQLT
jgi:hypothetical protein